MSLYVLGSESLGHLIARLPSGRRSCDRAGRPGRPPASARQAWRPTTAPWQWQLQGKIDTSVEASVYDIDGFETPASTVRRLHRQGRRAICYLDVGSWENYRPDAKKFPRSVLGERYEGFPERALARHPPLPQLRQDRSNAASRSAPARTSTRSSPTTSPASKTRPASRSPPPTSSASTAGSPAGSTPWGWRSRSRTTAPRPGQLRRRLRLRDRRAVLPVPRMRRSTRPSSNTARRSSRPSTNSNPAKYCGQAAGPRLQLDRQVLRPLRQALADLPGLSAIASRPLQVIRPLRPTGGYGNRTNRACAHCEERWRRRWPLVAVAALCRTGDVGSPLPPPPSLTLKTVKVGAPGNPSVGIVPFTDAVYRSCAEAAGIKPPCQEVGGVKYGYGIGQLEVTVAQWVAFLNTADPSGRDRHKLYSSERELLGLAQVRADRLLRRRRQGPPLLGCLPGMGRQALRLRQLPARGALRQLALQRPAALQEGRREGAFRYVTYRVRLSRETPRAGCTT